MIRIQRFEVPNVLISRGAENTRLNREEYEADPDAYRRGDARFTIDSKIYGHKTVKDALVKAQHAKCCYCERKILASGYGDVEHFRPKGAVLQDENSAEERPGYYWLAYEWTNLLVSCSVCNTSHKRTFFPLANPSKRARAHTDLLARERPMLVDPAAEDPRRHIRFEGDAPYALTERGRKTIERLGLRRGDLLERRQKLLRILTALRSVVEKLGPTEQESQDASALMRRYAESSEEFSSMVTDFLAAPFVPASTTSSGGRV
jgi:uncharacterized protein (TIGR02646 family)